MQISRKTISDPLLSLRDAITRRPDFSTTFVAEEPPLRTELFSREQLAQHGRGLAASHRLSTKRSADELLTRLAENETLLIAVRALVTDAVNDDRRITPAGEWLLDNFYLIEEQIRTARRHLPRGYSRELPRLAGGPSATLPRVYDIALETISHGDGVGLSGGDPPDDRRAVGHPDHAAPRPDREPPPRGGSDRG